ncbi:MAG: AAA family ATPase, partial [Rikenellaceae bacterium]
MVERVIREMVCSKLGTGKAIILMGARQTGKTTLLKDLFAGDDTLLWLNGDEADVRDMFENITSTRLK